MADVASDPAIGPTATVGSHVPDCTAAAAKTFWRNVSFIVLERPGDPTSARVDYEQAGRALRAPDQRLEAAVAESTVHRPLVGARAARPDGVPLLGGMPVTASCRPRPGASPHRREVTGATRDPRTDRTLG